MSLSLISGLILIAMEIAVVVGIAVPPSLQMMLSATLTIFIGCHFGVVARADEVSII